MNKSFRNIVIVVIVVIIALSMSACGSGDLVKDLQNTAGKVDTSGVTMTTKDAPDFLKAAQEKALDLFCQDNPKAEACKNR